MDMLEAEFSKFGALKARDAPPPKPPVIIHNTTKFGKVAYILYAEASSVEAALKASVTIGDKQVEISRMEVEPSGGAGGAYSGRGGSAGRGAFRGGAGGGFKGGRECLVVLWGRAAARSLGLSPCAFPTQRLGVLGWGGSQLQTEFWHLQSRP